MPTPSPAPRRSRATRRQTSYRPNLEHLETRDLPSGSGLPVEQNDTLNNYQSLGSLDDTAATPVSGHLGNGSAGAADVNWYRFTVSSPTHVHLHASADDSAGLNAVLSLYNTDTGNTFDPGVMLAGHRLLSQVVGAGGTATLDQDLAPGTYYVAISGAGNPYFYPLLANSGLNGATGGYQLQADGTTLLSPPLLLSSDLNSLAVHHANGNPVLDTYGNPVLASSPLVLHFDTSSPLDPASDVHLFDDYGDDMPISYNIDPVADELQIMPVQALAPDLNEYHVVVYNSDDSAIQFTQSFTVAGIEGNLGATTADDVLSGAHNLGDVTNGQIAQAAGAIGTDPYYDPINAAGDPNQGNPANQVDLYKFHVGGTGLYALDAEVFAGRIGSSLEPALTLFALDANGQIVLGTNGKPLVLGGNNGTGNDTQAESDVGAINHKVPLLTDPALFVSLKPGDYLLAVSTRNNYSNPAIGQFTGQNGLDPTQLVFDPTQSHSGTLGGGSVGNYVLNLRVQPAAYPTGVDSITVSTSSGSSGAAVVGPPTTVDVHFSGPVDLGLLAFQDFQNNLQSDLASVFIQDANGATFVPRLLSYDATTFEAQFFLLDRLPTGTYTLHLSGADGLTDFSGNPLAGNSPGGDYVFTFTVTGAPALNLHAATALGNDDSAHAQDLGVIFGHEFEHQFTVRRDFTTAAASPNDTADYYSFQVLEGADYSFSLSASGSSTPMSPDLVDAAGNTLHAGSGGILLLHLDPGTYLLRVDGRTPAQSTAVVYNLIFSMGRQDEHPTPLTVGPAPALRLQLVSNTPPPAPPAPPILTLPTPPSSGQSGSGSGQTTTGTIPISTTTGTTSTFSTTISSGFDNLLPGLANALAAAPIGGIRGPNDSTDSPQVVRLDLAPPTYATLDTSNRNRVTAFGMALDESASDNFFLRFGPTVDRTVDGVIRASNALFSGILLAPKGDAGENQEEDKESSENPGMAVPEQAEETSNLDSVWSAAFAFVGSLALRGWQDDDKKTRRLAPGQHFPRTV